MAPGTSIPSGSGQAGQASKYFPGETLSIPKPPTGEILEVISVPGDNLVFAFDPGAATVVRAGADLLFQIDGGGGVKLTDFFMVGDLPLPSITLPDGLIVASADFLANFDVDVETAGGPTAADGVPNPDVPAVEGVEGAEPHGSLGPVHNFVLGEDLLRLDGLFAGLNEPTMDDILQKLGDGLDISVADAHHATVTAGSQTIEVTLLGQGFDDHDSGDKAALLMQLLCAGG